MKIELMDTTLRDGEQTEGVSYNANEKLTIAKHLIEKVKVDAIEVTSARISDDEFSSLKKICEWAKKSENIHKIEVLAFVDNTKSAKWIYDAGAKVINLLCKGSFRHLEGQLRKTLEEHVSDIEKEVLFAKQNNMTLNVYLEDWSGGMINSKDYVISLIERLQKLGIKRMMLADTLGLLDYKLTFEFISELVKKYPAITFDFHGHNDYDLAVSNCVAAVTAGAKRVHTTVNGLGERSGNAKLASVVCALKDFCNVEIGINEKELFEISEIVEILSGIRIAQNTPIVGENVFTQNCGVHADGDKKKGLYQTKLSASRFGREITYSLGKTAGIASIDQNMQQLSLEYNLSDEQKRAVLSKVKELAHKKQTITREDLPYIISDILETPIKRRARIASYDFFLSKEKSPRANVTLEIDGKEYTELSEGDGQYDAFMNSVKKAYSKLDRELPELIDYVVRIPKGGRTSAIVETTIYWRRNGRVFKTRGVDSDQLLSAIDATENMLNINGF